MSDHLLNGQCAHARIARRLVRAVGDRWMASLCAHEQGRMVRARFWARIARSMDPVRRLAVRLHRDAAVDQMALEGWWG